MNSSAISFFATYGLYLFLIVFNVGLSFIGASMAKKKGYSFGGFWCLGFFSYFIIGIIVAVIVPDLYRFELKPEYRYYQPAVDTRVCSNCGNALKGNDVFCSQCGAKS